MKVAVVGSGLAGLSCAWALSDPSHYGEGVSPHEVHLFERAESIGMDSASVDVLGGKARVDVPMRGFFPGYYPTLVRLYRLLGIQFKKRNHTVIFCRMEGGSGSVSPFFSYTNVLRGLLGFGVPLPNFHKDSLKEIFQLSTDWVRFFYRAHRFSSATTEERRAQLVPKDMTIHQYVTQHGFSKIFIFDSLYAMLTGICTCPFEDCMEYPARLILEFYGSGVLFEGTSAVEGGVKEVCKVMSRNIGRVHLATPVHGIQRFKDQDGSSKVRIHLGEGRTEEFDAVVIASQANHALSMLKDPSEEERVALSSFKYVKSPTYIHHDERVMASQRKHWRGLSVVTNSQMNAAMSTMYMNDIMPNLASERDIFQTVSPCISIKEESMISVTHFERVVVNKKSVEGLKRLLANQGANNTYFVGSYAWPGIPLLEGCVCSALDVAERLGASRGLALREERSAENGVPRKALPADEQNITALLSHRILAFFFLVFAWLLDRIL